MNFFVFAFLFILNINISFAAFDESYLASVKNSKLAKFLTAHRLLSEKDDRVCIFVWTYVDTRNWDIDWQSKFLSFMDRTLVQSLERQCPLDSSCSNLAQYKLILEMSGNPELNLRTREHFENFKNVILTYRSLRRSQHSTDLLKLLSEMVIGLKCNWVSHIWIDADDAFMDGFFEYVTTEIPKVLTGSSTLNGSDWRGAVFLSKNLPRIYLNKDRCGLGLYKEKQQEFVSYHPKEVKNETRQCGESAGRGILLKREVWDKLDEKDVHWCDHNKFTQYIREWVMHGLGYTEYSSGACNKHVLKNQTSSSDYVIQDEAESRLLYINFLSDWKTSGLLITTPLSGHFPWTNIAKLPLCNEEQISEIQSMVPQDIRWLMKTAQNINVTVSESCKNNFRLAKGGVGLFRNKCSEQNANHA